VRIVVLPGDGIGPEISSATVEALELVNRDLGFGLEFETYEIGVMPRGHSEPESVLGRLNFAPSRAQKR
jgi:isocitrate/isopropylmalate dehydrogenase